VTPSVSDAALTIAQILGWFVFLACAIALLLVLLAPWLCALAADAAHDAPAEEKDR
jgi:hypothetical protein